MARSRYIVILIKPWKDPELVSSLENWTKIKLEILVIQQTSIWPNFILIVLRIQKKCANKHKCNFHYVEIPKMTSQTLKSMDSTKTKRSRYLENETLFFTQMKKFINYASKATVLQKISCVAEVTFKKTFKKYHENRYFSFFHQHFQNSNFKKMRNHSWTFSLRSIASPQLMQH